MHYIGRWRVKTLLRSAFELLLQIALGSMMLVLPRI